MTKDQIEWIMHKSPCEIKGCSGHSNSNFGAVRLKGDAFQRMLDQWPECSFIGCLGDCFIQLLSADGHKLGSIYLKHQDIEEKNGH